MRTAHRERRPAPGPDFSRSAAGKARAIPVKRSRRSTISRSTCASSRRHSSSEIAMKTPHIKTALPGPKAEAMLKRDALVVSPSYPRDYPFVISHAKGAEAWDVDGNRFLDFMAGIAVCATGHSHATVVQAITQAAEKFVHISSDYWHEGQIALAEKISALNPVGGPSMSFFCQSGTESVEAALKLARNVSGRGRFIGFLGGFHGRTMGSLSFTSSKYTQQKGFFPTMPGVTHVPYPNQYRPLLAGSDQGAAVLNYIENVLFKSNVPSNEVAAILIEPIQGEGGYLVPPDGFLQGLRALCDRHGILLIFDEVQSGIGRTGKTLAKGLGSGLPIGMMVAKRALMEKWQRGSHGNTYGGNPVCCAAALATLDLVSSELCANAARMGEYFIGRLRELQGKYACIGDVRGKGLMLGMELVEDRTSKVPAAKLSEKFIRQAYLNGLLLLSCGQST